ncbi:MAG: geranylgeranyl reductase family protein [Geminocystis sp.]|nr:geranylgeranyl reductase family protein [Geminocystis sp.]MCX8079493.1 geranylgeranyl reductase family protein [Geminocystis sp.]MDW8464156.1 geranylgeranyl reductase family protein [Geminocystis sp.]
MKYECIVIGAGPSGATAAYHLAKRGVSVLLLEKASLPRYKPCGGGVSPAIQSWFDFDLTPAISVKSHTVYCTWQQEEVVAIDLGNTPIWMVRRDVFDYFLVQQAVKQGAQLLTDTEVTAIEFQKDSWLVHTPKGHFRGSYIVGADGAKGNTARWLGFTKQKKTVVGALEVEIPAAQPTTDTYFEFGLVAHGYAWNFPKADGYSLGAGGFAKRRKAQSFHRLLENYASGFCLRLQDGCEYGHPIALWDGVQKLHAERAILVGEAACVVDPFTAEGIRPSVYSGMKGAEAIINGLAGQTDALDNYSATMAEEWGKEMMWAKRLSQAFYRLPRLSYQLGVKHPSAGKTMVKIFTGQLKYSQVAQRGLNILSRLF